MRGQRRVGWRFGRVLWVVALLAPWPTLNGEAQEAVRERLSNEVIGASRAAPGETVRFRVTVSGGRPGAAVMIYEQLGSNLSPDVRPRPRLDFTPPCVISALPVANLPGADPGAPAGNRVVCPVLTDEQGRTSLILEVQVVSPLVAPASEASTRSVAAIIEPLTGRVGQTASAQIELIR
jgi:hypothetical protein